MKRLAFIFIILSFIGCTNQVNTNYNYTPIKYEKIINLSSNIELSERFALTEMFLIENINTEETVYSNKDYGVLIGILKTDFYSKHNQPEYAQRANGYLLCKASIYLKDNKCKVVLTNFIHEVFRMIYDNDTPPRKFIAPTSANAYFWKEIKDYTKSYSEHIFISLEKKLNERIETRKDW